MVVPRAATDRREPAFSLVPLGPGPRPCLVRDRHCAVSVLSRMAETSRVFGAWSVPAPEYVIERRVDGLSVLGGRMGHATPGGAGPAAAAPSTGRAAPAGGPAEGRRRAAGAGVGQFGVAVVAVLSAELHLRPMTDSGRRLADRRDGSSCFGCFECFE